MNWCFTHNNYDAANVTELRQVLQHADALFVFSEEIGDSGTKHLQGAVRFKTRARFTYVKKLFPTWNMHWEKCKGSWKQNIVYCTKVKDWSKIHGNIPEASRFSLGEKAVLDLYYENVKWEPWQQRIIDIVDGPVDDRRIYWFWEARGKIGKTFLARWLCIQYRCQIGDGKQADVFNGIALAMEEDQGAWPRLIIMDIPRSSQEFVNYGALEKMKNGFLYSGKYKGAQIIFPSPHVIIFSNEEPIYGKMSMDRWKVVELLHVDMPTQGAPRPAVSQYMI